MNGWKSKLVGLLLEPSLRWFLLIGLGNTVLSLAIQLLLFSYTKLGYWYSSGIAFCIASISSFYFNRTYSFRSDGSLVGDAVRFALNIAVCYFIAYGMAQPLVNWLLPKLGDGFLVYQGQISLVAGNGLFTCLNYVGQRFFAFKSKKAAADTVL